MRYAPTIRALAWALLLAGCTSTERVFRGTRAASMREAGSVHLAVLAVAPWSEYVQALQPNFELSADQALSKVANDSRWRLEERQKAVGIGAESVLLDELSGGRKPEKPESGLQSPPHYREAPFERLGPMSPVPGGDERTGPDAMLRYSSAAALYQEVQLLNRYIRDAAIPAGFRPYMVRLQVSLMPSRRHAPYDAYTTLSFFLPGQDGALPVETFGPVEEPRGLASPFGNGPKALPLLVTDNLEASVEAHSFDRASTLLLSLLAYPDNSFIEPMYGALLQGTLRDQVFGRDLNSLLTIARLSENTLRIRLGATQEATANYAMIPRNHNITLLLMVPEGAPPLMEVVSRTVLVDSETGEELAPAKEGAELGEFRCSAAARGLPDFDLDTLAELHELAQRNDQPGFLSRLRRALPEGHAVLDDERPLWIELVSLVVRDQYASSRFELPGQGEDVDQSSEVFRSQTVVAEDDGQQTTIVLREARFPEFEQILAVLSVSGVEPAVVLPSEFVELDLTRRELRVGFPSFMRWNLLASATEAPALRLRLSWAGEEQFFDVRHVQVQPQ